MTKRPHDEIIGCAPAGESSTIERRRWPSANQAPASAKTAPSSGPRWRSVSVIASATAVTVAGALFPRRSQTPATPHISAILFPDHSSLSHALLVFDQSEISDTFGLVLRCDPEKCRLAFSIM